MELVEASGQTKIRELDVATSVQKNIVGLDISKRVVSISDLSHGRMRTRLTYG